MLLQIEVVIKNEKWMSLHWAQSHADIRQNKVVSRLNKLVLGKIFPAVLPCAWFPSTFSRCLNTRFQQRPHFNNILQTSCVFKGRRDRTVMNSVRFSVWSVLILYDWSNSESFLKIYLLNFLKCTEESFCVCQIVLVFCFSCHVSLKDLMAAWHTGFHCRENHSGLSASWSRMCHEPRCASFPCMLCSEKEDDKVCEANESYISRRSACKPGYTLGSNTVKMMDRSV